MFFSTPPRSNPLNRRDIQQIVESQLQTLEEFYRNHDDPINTAATVSATE